MGVTDLLLTGVLKSSTSARTAVVELMETTALGMAEKERLARRPSARSTRRFPVSVLCLIDNFFSENTTQRNATNATITKMIYLLGNTKILLLADNETEEKLKNIV